MLSNFPVIKCTGFPESESGRRIYRARFSSVTEKDILKAMDNLVEPNKDEALAVDARQELDLKVGVAFTRFQTRYFQGKYGNLDSTVISYVSNYPSLPYCFSSILHLNLMHIRWVESTFLLFIFNSYATGSLFLIIFAFELYSVARFLIFWDKCYCYLMVVSL